MGRGVTLEHAPPKTMGGREVCLTCKSCNSRASATSDQAVKRSKSPPELQIDTSGTKRSARFWPDGIPPSSMPYGFGSGPAAEGGAKRTQQRDYSRGDEPDSVREADDDPKDFYVAENAERTPRGIELPAFCVFVGVLLVGKKRL